MNPASDELPLLLCWRPDGIAAPPPNWVDARSNGVLPRRPLWLGNGVTATVRGDRTDACWSSRHWQPAIRPDAIRITLTSRSLRIDVPPVWRARVYFAWRSGQVFASSDLRTLANAISETRPSTAGIGRFLTTGHATVGCVPSLYRDIDVVGAGHGVTLRPDGRVIVERTWRPEEETDHAALSLPRATTRLRVALDQAAEQVLARHDRIGCLFSGGLDSSLVAATLLHRAPDRVVLLNLGSSFGTDAEAWLRSRFVAGRTVEASEVDLPPEARLIRSLRSVNGVAPSPAGSVFSHVFEQILATAKEIGCTAVATGDGGDEIFAERESVLGDLMQPPGRAVLRAAAHFALLRGERMSDPLHRAWAERVGSPGPRIGAEAVLFSPELRAALADAAEHEMGARRAARQAGWTASGIDCWRRAASVPEWEPLSSADPGFAVLSPLVDERILSAALSLRRDLLVPVGGDGRKRLLRHAAMGWLPEEIAHHPKIGSTDAALLRRMRVEEHGDLLDLFSSDVARRVGLRVPPVCEDVDHPLWRSDRWLRAAALIAWFETPSPPDGRRPRTWCTTRAESGLLPSKEQPAAVPSGPPPTVPRSAEPPVPAGHVMLVACLNLVVQLVPGAFRSRWRTRRIDDSRSHDRAERDDRLRETLTDLARRAMVVPFVTADSRVMHQALACYLSLRGRQARLIDGVAAGTPDRRYWLEVADHIIDVNGTEVPLIAAGTAQTR